jgi:hypothetical protein
MTAPNQVRGPAAADTRGTVGLAPPAGPDGDRRFTIGLVLDVARTLEAHGYGTFEGRDFVELHLHLFHLVCAPEGACTGGSLQ